MRTMLRTLMSDLDTPSSQALDGERLLRLVSSPFQAEASVCTAKTQHASPQKVWRLTMRCISLHCLMC